MLPALRSSNRKNQMITTPTVGRKVWYRPSASERVGENAIVASTDQPTDATIVAVWGDRCVNLVIFDGNGKKHVRMSAYLRQDDEELPSWVTGYAEWMPYQLKQAVKHAAEGEVAKD